MDRRAALENVALDERIVELDQRRQRQLESLNGMSRRKALALQARYLDSITTADALSTMSFPPPKWAVPGFICEGATMLVGRPKKGKSWFGLNVGCAVALGGTALGSIECQPGDVLYLGLEDTAKRMQNRLEQMLGDRAWPSRLNIQYEWPTLNEGGLELIEAWVHAAENPRLVMVDTFKKVRPPDRRGHGDYGEDYDAIAPLQKLAGDKEFAMLIMHHQRKGSADDILDTVSGSTGLTGAVDSILVLHTDASGYRLLSGRGRDIEEFDVAVQFDKMTGLWSIVGSAEDVRRSDTRQDILELLLDHSGAMTPKMVAEAIDGLTEDNARQTLLRMAKAEEVRKVKPGWYEAL